MTNVAGQLRTAAAGLVEIADDTVSQITDAMTRLIGAATALAELADALDGQPQTPAVTVTAQAGAGRVKVAWQITPESAAEQVTGWLVGRDGTDTSGAPPWSTTDRPEVRSRDFLKLRPGAEYTFTVKALLAGGGAIAAAPVTATPTGPTSPGPTPGPNPTPAGGVPLAGRSGLGHNTGVFVGGTDVAATRYFADYVGGELDAYLTFTDRDSWADMFTIHPSWAKFVAAGGIVIISNPPQPEPEGNSRTAAGDHDARWRGYGEDLARAGLNSNRVVERIGWECNGDWYPWSWGSPRERNTPESYVGAVRHVSNALKTTAPNVRVSFNLNRGSRRAGHDWRRVADQLVTTSPVTGQRYVDVIEVDTYDMYKAARNAAEWRAQIEQDPGPLSVEAYCREHGVQIGYGEWGPIRPGAAGGTAGGDNPYYAHGMWDLIQGQRDILAYEIAYEHLGTNSYDHRWVSANLKPKFSAAYLSHWRRAPR